jgi:hypothetical protein
MRYLYRFLRLPAEERWLLVKITLLLIAIRLGLWLLPFQTLLRLMARLSGHRPRLRNTGWSRETIVWAVETVGRHVRSASTCLTQALAVQVLLARRGHPALLRIGVVRGDKGRLEAHAWVESESEVVIGEYELERYTPLVALRADKKDVVVEHVLMPDAPDAPRLADG